MFASLNTNLESLKGYAKQRIKDEIKKRLKKKIVTTILKNPYFWAAVGIILAIVLVFYMIAAIVASINQITSEAVISDNILPPQIYVRELEEHITDAFGERIDPITGQQSFHNGMDIGVPSGTPVSASSDGVVEVVSYPKSTDSASTKDAGTYVAIAASDKDIDSSTRYLHLSEAYVTPGQTVKKGQIIGLSGNTGRSTGSHLHFEMIPHGGEAIDPQNYILIMSKMMDVASEAAFNTMNKIPFAQMDSDAEFHSKKMLYISGLYMEDAAPAFNPVGTIYIKGLANGSSPILGTLPNNGSVPVPQPEDGPVSVPPDLGTLTDPFFLKYAGSAQREERRSGIPASITLAQAALESGRGASTICNNFFGIKAFSGYSGPTCSATTNEEYGGITIPIIATFRAYSGADESFADHSDFLLENGRYKTALEQENPYIFANEMQRAGYATDSQYANKLKSIIRGQNLASLDENKGIDPITNQPFNDVAYSGSGSGVGSNEAESVTVVFGISQLYGSYAHWLSYWWDINGARHTQRNPMIDPIAKQPVINLVNFNNVLSYYSGEDIEAPNVAIKDIPSAIAVTLESGSSESIFVSKVDYIKGNY